MLFRLFGELGLDPSELALVLSSDRYSYNKLIMHVVKDDGDIPALQGLDKRDFLKEVLRLCLCECGSWNLERRGRLLTSAFLRSLPHEWPQAGRDGAGHEGADIIAQVYPEPYD
jgi:hypothetical protein